MPKENDIQLAEILQEAGYRGKVHEKEGVVSSVGGLGISLFTFSNNTIQIICGINLGGDTTIDLASVNDFNKVYRYSKLFLDTEGDLVLSADFNIDFESSTCSSEVEKCMNLFEGSLSYMRKLITEADGNSTNVDEED